MNATILDVVIIGGGPGGLCAALLLGRSRRKVTVIDADQPRNAVVQKTHGFLTRDGISPKELKELGLQELKQYESISFINDKVVHLEKKKNRFIITTKSGSTHYSRKVIVATGMVDDLPDIQGLSDVYGTSVFHCPYCDGWERKDEPLAVFGSGKNLADFTKVIYNWSRDLIVFTNGKTKDTKKSKQVLESRKIPIIEASIKRLHSNHGKLESIETINGEVFQRTGGFMMDTGERQAFRIPEKFGIKLNKWGGYETEEHGLTKIDGLYVVGDAKNGLTGLICAAGEGYEAGVAINHELISEDWNSMETK